MASIRYLDNDFPPRLTYSVCTDLESLVKSLACLLFSRRAKLALVDQEGSFEDRFPSILKTWNFYYTLCPIIAHARELANQANYDELKICFASNFFCRYS